MIGSEALPYAKTGGLADVLGALLRAIARLGWDVTLFMPRYRGIDAGTFHDQFGVTVGGYYSDVRLFEQDHRFVRTLGLRIGGFGYSTDVVTLDEAAFAALEGVDTWLVGCFQRPPHTTHANLERVLEWVERLRPRRTVLTHMGTDLDWAWMHRHLPSGVEPGYDGLTVSL